jgi:hypothetical protein
VEAARDLKFSRGHGQPIGVHRFGATGTIVSVMRSENGLIVVDVMFDDNDTPYRCEFKHAVFQFRLEGGVSSQRIALRRLRDAGDE